MRKRRRSQLLEADQQGVGKLIQDFSILERDWNSFNSSKPRPLRRMSSADSSNAILKTLQLLSNSPRSLMSSLQIRGRSDAAREEIIRDRKAAIESGKLKGRRLFEAEESETEVGFGEREEICSVSSYGNEVKGSCGRSKQDQVVSGSGYHVRCCSGSSLSDEKVERGEVVVVGGGGGGGEKVVGLNVEEVKRCEVGVKGKGGEMWMILGGWFSIVLMIFALGIIYMSCIIGGYGDEDEVMLVPT
ncbi:hypothetical protein Vadar_025200 [Vaccinium darrowii]|uniref:Uncharacterized protein n=1 Tax=Vaccinium darrowii TaxID=229202 RepID=A0ACB7ZMM7_9ERIC|nr:hypothetical protein Vadar_025200 [Vaccinium darrowii]